jgi:hypothetical protein
MRGGAFCIIRQLQASVVAEAGILKYIPTSKKVYVNPTLLIGFTKLLVDTRNRARATRAYETLKLQNMDEDGCYVQLYFI